MIASGRPRYVEDKHNWKPGRVLLPRNYFQAHQSKAAGKIFHSVTVETAQGTQNDRLLRGGLARPRG